MLRNPIIGGLTFVLFLIAINVVWLDIVIVSDHRTQGNEANQIEETAAPEACNEACQNKIAASVIAQLSPVASAPSTVTSTTVEAAQEYYIPLGSGTTTSNQYVPIPGAQAMVDTSLYASIKTVTFEVFLRNPTGNGVAYAKLYNATDQHDVWFSEVSMIGGGIALQTAPINLDSGNKLYQVYLKSTLPYDIYADNARIHIITQ